MSGIKTRDVDPRGWMRPAKRAAAIAVVLSIPLITSNFANSQETLERTVTLEQIREQVELDVKLDRPPEEGIERLVALGAERDEISDSYTTYRDLFVNVLARGALDFELSKDPRNADELLDLFDRLLNRAEHPLSELELLDIYEQAYLEAKRRDSQRTWTRIAAISGTVVAMLIVVGWLLWQRWRFPSVVKWTPANEKEPAEPPAHQPKVIEIGKKARIASVRLRRIRGFEDFHLDFLDGEGSPRLATLVIGKNGTNKSTLLRCIALGLADQADATSLISKPIGAMVSENATSGEIEIDLLGEDGETYKIKKRIRSSEGKEYIESEPSDAPSYDLFVCAYGAGRAGVGTDPGRKYRILDSVLTLFDYGAALIDTELTLLRLEKTLSGKQYQATKDGLKRVLNLSEDDDLRAAKGGGVEILESSLDQPVRLESWADGYRLTLSWLLDLYGWAMRAKRIGDKGVAYGIALVDELDQHLHPSMQARVFRDVKKILPEMQLVATTHSPLMALGASPEELVALRRANGRVERADSPDFSFFTAGDMLKHKALFDTGVYAPEVNEMLERYHRLAAIPPEKLSRAEREELRTLADQLAARQTIASPRDEEEDREIQDLLQSLQPSPK